MTAKDQLALEQPPQHAIDWLFVAVLSMTAGAVDVIGFLALGGLFTRDKWLHYHWVRTWIGVASFAFALLSTVLVADTGVG